jgi:drug/metabolite transporter (DMT)-like permease
VTRSTGLGPPTTAVGRAYLLLGALVVVWGSHWAVAKIGLGIVPPFTYGTLRLLTGAAVLAALMHGAGRLRPPARDDLAIVVSYGILAVALGIALMFLALPFVPAGRSSILAYTLPLWVVPIMAVTARVAPTRAELGGLLLGLAGLALLLTPLAIDWSSPDVLLGSAMLLASAFAGALALVHVRAHRWRGTPFDVQIWQLLVALVPILVLALILEADRWASIAWDPRAVAVILYSGPLATAFAYWASQSVTRAIGPTATSIGYLAVPVMGILAGAVLLGETIGPLDLLGLLVTTSGIVAVLQARRANQSGEAPWAPVERAAPTGPASAGADVEVVLADGADLPEARAGGRSQVLRP